MSHTLSVWTSVLSAVLLFTSASATAQTGIPVSDDRVVATVGGAPLLMSDVERYWIERDVSSYARVKQLEYEAQRRFLDELIDLRLVEAEARKRKVSVAELMTQHVPALAERVSDAEIKQQYDRSAMPGQGVTYEQARPVVAAVLTQQKVTAARKRFVEGLRAQTRVDIDFEYSAPRQTVTVAAADPVKGGAKARIDIVEFSEFQCPFCKQVSPTLQQLQARYGDSVRLAWKHFPLPNHKDARLAAEAAECARDQGKFWEYHDTLFQNQAALGAADLKQYAQELRLERVAFDGCLESGLHRAKVLAGVTEGRRLGITATPTVFINGRVLTGTLPAEKYEQIIREELGLAACSTGTCPLPDVERRGATR